MTDRTSHETYMQRAIELAEESHRRGDFAVASLIVREGRIVAEGTTTILRDQDPTAHAEMNTIRSAARALGNRFLEGCTLYTTYEPCPMCTAAAIWAKIETIVYGAGGTDATESHPWRVQIPAAEVIARGTPQPALVPSCLREQCIALLRLTRP